MTPSKLQALIDDFDKPEAPVPTPKTRVLSDRGISKRLKDGCPACASPLKEYPRVKTDPRSGETKYNGTFFGCSNFGKGCSVKYSLSVDTGRESVIDTSAFEEGLRLLVRDVLVEAVMLSPQQLAAKAALEKVNPGASGKAVVLFSRILSKRIDPEEAEQMAGEVRSLAAADPRAVKAFDTALEDLRAAPDSERRIGDMISSTLNAPAPGRNITMTSLAKR